MLHNKYERKLTGLLLSFVMLCSLFAAVKPAVASGGNTYNIRFIVDKTGDTYVNLSESFTVISGVTNIEDGYNNNVRSITGLTQTGTDVVFEIEPAPFGGELFASWYYTDELQPNFTVEHLYQLTPHDDGKYVIPGNKLTGDITLKVLYSFYYYIRFDSSEDYANDIISGDGIEYFMIPKENYYVSPFGTIRYGTDAKFILPEKKGYTLNVEYTVLANNDASDSVTLLSGTLGKDRDGWFTLPGSNIIGYVHITAAYSEKKVADYCDLNFKGPYLFGYTDGTVRPEGSITRGEFAAIVYRLIKPDLKNVKYSNPFSDVKEGSFYYDAVTFFAAKGILHGYPDGTFKPNGMITRAEAVKVFTEFTKEESSDTLFTDIANHWSHRFIETAYINGWLAYEGSGVFRPDDNITRAETVRIANAVISRAPENAIITDENIALFSDFDIEAEWAYEIAAAAFGV